jgi:ATP-binding cassette subfamily B (MDR/TAP) protein 1
MVDGHDLKSLQLNWWRSQVALVSQEPALFNDTIYGNIAMSKPGKLKSEHLVAPRISAYQLS